MVTSPWWINVCESRGQFARSFAAAMQAGAVTVLPSARAEAAVQGLVKQFDAAHVIDDRAAVPRITPPLAWQHWPDEQLAVIAHTSGSTGDPVPHRKTWGALRACTSENRTHAFAGVPLGATIVATVPPQHMYGFETTVLLPLLTDLTLSPESPFYPQDVAAALDRVTGPAVLVTTPTHLRALLRAGVRYPNVCRIISATAPLSVETAQAAEARFGCEVHEVFGATETCVIAHRRTVAGPEWTLYPSVVLENVGDKSYVTIAARGIDKLRLADQVQPCGTGQFILNGRCSDLVKRAGKRASLAHLNELLMQTGILIDGVYVPASDDDGRLAVAGVVHSDYADQPSSDVLRALRQALAPLCDAVFLPRRLVLRDALPRNAVGKLTSKAVTELMLAGSADGRGDGGSRQPRASDAENAVYFNQQITATHVAQ